MDDRLQIRIDAGPNAQARAWAVRLIARVVGVPFRIDVLPVTAPRGPGPALYYGRGAGLAGVTIEQSEFFEIDLGRFSAPVESPAAMLGGVPVLFGDGEIVRADGATRIGADLVASAFYLASCIEERSLPGRDRHGRFPAAASFLGKSRFLAVPVIDEYARIIAAEIGRLYPGLVRRRPWPGEAAFALCVTHDIEHLITPLRLGYMKARALAGGRLAVRGQFAEAATQWGAGVRRAIRMPSPLSAFEHLRSHARPWPATFYFFGQATSPLDGTYDVGAAEVTALIGELRAEGCEIGVHLGYETGADDALMDAQRSRVERASGARVEGERHHYLRAQFPSAWKAHEKAGFAYDASLAFAETAGFRAGTCHPFMPFDIEAGRELDLVEVPLVAMDGTFFRYGSLDEDETVARVLGLAETVRRAGGVFTLLWHNTMIDPVDRPAQSRAYARITAALKEMPAWGATVSECVRNWKSYGASLEEKHG
jgi:hypothetical protein